MAPTNAVGLPGALNLFCHAALFLAGSITFDCGLIMRNIAHEWESATEMYI